MQITFIVTIDVTKIEDQPTKEFIKEDVSAFRPYLAEKIQDCLTDTWQYNARVQSVSVS